MAGRGYRDPTNPIDLMFAKPISQEELPQYSRDDDTLIVNQRELRQESDQIDETSRNPLVELIRRRQTQGDPQYLRFKSQLETQ